MNTNLYDEILKVLEENKKSPEDITWVGRGSNWCTWQDFKQTAMDTNYDNGFGGQEIASDLLVSGKNFWLERHEYDGSEWWGFKTQLKKPKKPKIYCLPKSLE